MLCSLEKSKKTYHNSHTRTLHDPRKQQQSTNDAPPRRPTLHTPRYYDAKRHERAQLDDDVKRDEEADGPPHAAKVFVLEARLLVRERGAHGFALDARAAAVEAHGDFALIVLAVRLVGGLGSRVCGGRHTELKLAQRGTTMLAIVMAVPVSISICHCFAVYDAGRRTHMQW